MQATGAERTERTVDILPYIRSIANSLRRRCTSLDLEDLVQAGCIGSLRAEKNFDPSRGVLFRHYARDRIRGAMLDQMRREGGYRSPNHRFIPRIDRLTTSDITLHNLPAREDPVPEISEEEVLAHLGAVGKERTRRLLLLHYYYGLPIDFVAAMEGVTSSRISQILHSARQQHTRCA